MKYIRFSAIIPIMLAVFFAACSEKYEEFSGKAYPYANYNKTVFTFSPLGGRDTLYVRSGDAKYLSLHSISILKMSGDTLSAPEQSFYFGERPRFLVSDDGIVLGSVTYSGCLVEKVETDEYTITALSDDNGFSIGAYQIEAKPKEKRETMLWFYCSTTVNAVYPDVPLIEVHDPM